MNNDFLNDLSESQRIAVEYIDGPSLVIAGAGSGKTRVLTYKIAYLLRQGISPWQIMALTFTNKAAREMKERIIKLVGDEAKTLQMGTFHSIFLRILRIEASAIGYDANFTIYDDDDSKSLCKMLIKQLGLDDKIYKPGEVGKRISDAKMRLITPGEYAIDTNLANRDIQSKMPEMPKLYDLYIRSCRKSNAMDFDDLLLYTYFLFSKHEDIRLKYAQRFRFVLVDEYQDTNYAQQQIVWLLTKDSQNICVVGDDAQSIYAFRGANIDNILDFQKLYEGSRLFKLEQNYRSTQRIVKAANSLISHNNRQIPKDVYSCNVEGEKLTLRFLSSDREEAANVCGEIKRCVRKGIGNWNDYAILYRTNSQSRVIEEQMLKDNIPYRIYGGMSFYQRKEIKDIIAYFRLTVNNNDDEAFLRALNYPARGIGDTTKSKLIAAAQAFGVSMWMVANAPDSYGLNINKGTEAKLQGFTSLITEFSKRSESEDVYAVGVDIIKRSGIRAAIFSGTAPDDMSRQENMEEFVSSMQEYVEGNREEGLPTGMVEYLQEISLMTDKDSDTSNEGEKVSLMTVHSAKGLEFPIVYVVGMDENIFPSQLSSSSMRELEEERRLLYVAITRAEKRCVLTSAKNRFRYGQMETFAPSRFLRDFDTSFIEIENGRASKTSNQAPKPRPYSFTRTPIFKPIPKPEPSRTTTPANCPFSIGDKVEHDRFGIGVITNLEGEGTNVKATVEFKSMGTKQLLLKFAKLRKL